MSYRHIPKYIMFLSREIGHYKVDMTQNTLTFGQQNFMQL